MKINYEISIGYPTAVKRGFVLIDDEDLEGLTREEKDDYIQEIIHENAMEHVDVGWEIEE